MYHSDVSFRYQVKYHLDSVADLFCRVTFNPSRWRKSVFGHKWRSHNLNDQRCDLKALMREKYFESVTLPLAVWNAFWLEKTSSMTYRQWESKIQGKGNFRGSSLMWFPWLLDCVFCKLYWNCIELLRFLPSEILCKQTNKWSS